MSVTYEVRSDAEMNCCPNEKDVIISKLKSHVFDLEQQERDLEALSKRYNQLQRDFDLLNENKRRLECELKQRDDTYNQKICNLRGENENLQISHNEKMSLNKKLFGDNENLAKTIDCKCSEIQDLTNKVNELNNKLSKLLCDKKDLEGKVDNLKNIRDQQNDEINKLIEDNMKLSQICQDQDEALKQNERDRQGLNDQIDGLRSQQDNMGGKLRAHGNDILRSQNALDKLNDENDGLEDEIKDYETQFDNFRKNNDNLQNDIAKEKALRGDKDKQNDKIKSIINKTEKQIDDLNHDYENLQAEQMQTEAEEKSLENENDKLREHLNLLTCQNRKLIDELAVVLNQDNKMKDLLSRKDQDASLLNDTRANLDHTRVAIQELEGYTRSPSRIINNFYSI